MFKRLFDRYIVLLITLLVIVAAVAGLLWLTKAVGENLAPIKPRVIIFGAPWCRYCPSDAVVQKLADDYDCVIVDHIDIDKHPRMAAKYGVHSVPRYFIEEDGVCTRVQDLGQLKAKLNELCSEHKHAP